MPNKTIGKSIQVIAEAGVNHNGSLKLALELVDVAAEAGADIIKFQTFIPEEVISSVAPKAEYQKKTTGIEQSQLEMARSLKLKDEDFFAIRDRCDMRDITFLSTPFDLMSIDFLVDEMGLKTIKIPSGEITNAPYILKIARKGVDIILSTGMSTLKDIETALAIISFGYLQSDEAPTYQNFIKCFRSEDGKMLLQGRVTILHCTTEYPAPIDEVNLLAMGTIQESFGLPIGFSDHTEGITAAISAAVLGATIVEKHFTLDKEMVGPDHKASLEPLELKNLIRSIREVERLLGNREKKPSPSEIPNQDIARKSLVARKAIKLGEVFTVENLAIKRPGTGMVPLKYWELLGKKATKEYSIDDLLNE